MRSHLHRVARAHLNRPFSPPEIQRCALESVFLTLASLAPDGLLRPTDFPWLDRPEAVEESRALEALRGAGALDSIGDDYSLTPLGRALAGLPADLAPAKLLLLSALAGVLSAGAALAASLSLPSPLRPASHSQKMSRAFMTSNAAYGPNRVGMKTPGAGSGSDDAGASGWCSRGGGGATTAASGAASASSGAAAAAAGVATAQSSSAEDTKSAGTAAGACAPPPSREKRQARAGV